MKPWSRLLAAFGLLFGVQTAEAVTVEPITMESGPPILLIHGSFDYRDDATDLVAKARESGATVVTFNSPGGNPSAAMRYGRMIRALGMSTFQIRSAECASACALAYIGGVVRLAESGSIGVHQSSFSAGSDLDRDSAVAGIQALTAEIMGYMSEMGVDPSLMQLALTIHSSDIRYLTTAEMNQYRVVTGADGASSPSAWAPPSPQPMPPSAPSGSPVGVASIEPPADPNKPTRLALYNGLDFLGRDIAMTSEPDAPVCASRCVAMEQCQAFTFNTFTPVGSGPNCFLKGSQGELDGNSAAISGRLLRRMEPDAPTYTFGSIDPQTGIYRNVDIPGHDLTRRPHKGASTEFDCRMACVREATCAAFVFLPQKKQCWLKAAVGGTRTMAGAVTGAKVAATFAPTHIPLN